MSLPPQISRQRNNPSSIMNNQGNKIPHKQNKKSSETKLQCMENYNLSDKEYKTALLKKLKMQGNSKRQLHRLRKKTTEQKEYFTKETESIKKAKKKFWKLKK